MPRCTRPRVGKRLPDGRVIPAGEDLWESKTQLPCGKCLDCRIAYANDWTMRAKHEMELHEHNSFVTLTYSDEALTKRNLETGLPTQTLSKKDWQDFAKRLRYYGPEFAYIAVGEYGDQYARPHIHTLLFGEDFAKDREYIGLINGYPTWTSQLLDKVWGHGRATVNRMEPANINYVCRYVIKKQYGPQKNENYEYVNSETGEVTEIEPEFMLMSRNPAIGKRWFDINKRDAFPADYLVTREGRKEQPPRYYLDLLKKKDEEQWTKIKQTRKEYAEKREIRDTRKNRMRREARTKRNEKLKVGKL